MLCVNCNKYPESNKKHHLCPICNQDRLHSKEERLEKQRQKQIEKQHKSLTQKKKTKRHAKTQQQIDKQIQFKELVKVYIEIDNERELVCESCNRPNCGLKLAHSHTISQRRRPDLALDKENIIIEGHGFKDSCHEKWESGNLEKMKSLITFEKKMEYIKKHDEGLYWSIMNK